MKKIHVRVIKKSDISAAEFGAETTSLLHGRPETSRSVAHKISNNVMSWVDELRERKTVEMVNSFNLLSKVAR